MRGKGRPPVSTARKVRGNIGVRLYESCENVCGFRAITIAVLKLILLDSRTTLSGRVLCILAHQERERERESNENTFHTFACAIKRGGNRGNLLNLLGYIRARVEQMC